MKTLRRGLSVKMKKSAIQAPAGARLDRFKKHRFPQVSLSGAPTDRGWQIQGTLAWEPVWLKLGSRLGEVKMIFKLTNIPPRSQGKSSKQLFYDLCPKAFPNLSSPAPNKFKKKPQPRNCYVKHSGPGQKPTLFHLRN